MTTTHSTLLGQHGRVIYSCRYRHRARPVLNHTAQSDRPFRSAHSAARWKSYVTSTCSTFHPDESFDSIAYLACGLPVSIAWGKGLSSVYAGSPTLPTLTIT